MDLSAIGSLNSALSQARTGDAVAVLVMKKAIDAQAQSALQLLQALPQPASNPANLGNSVDVRV
ncbi:MAG: putative motility protein [Dechloromonas sp.]|nr:MAG: putative motility protein [Dechloromonas sp.]